MDRRMDGRTDGQMETGMYGLRDTPFPKKRQKRLKIYSHWFLRMERWTDRQDVQMGGWTDGRVGGRTDGQTDRWTDVRTNE